MSQQHRKTGPAEAGSGTVRTFDQLRAEARAGIEPAEPYRLDTGDGVIEIESPERVGQVFALRKGSESPEEDLLRVLCGEHYETVYALLADEHISVYNALIQDMTRHFSMGRLADPTGGGS